MDFTGQVLLRCRCHYCRAVPCCSNTRLYDHDRALLEPGPPVSPFPRLLVVLETFPDDIEDERPRRHVDALRVVQENRHGNARDWAVEV